MPRAEGATWTTVASPWLHGNHLAPGVLNLTPPTKRPTGRQAPPPEGLKLIIFMGLDVIFLIRLGNLEQENFCLFYSHSTPTTSYLRCWLLNTHPRLTGLRSAQLSPRGQEQNEL